MNSALDLKRLWTDADSIWEAHSDEGAFAGYVSADYPEIYRSLQVLKKRAHTFLEWGSGLGVVSIMASRLGYQAFGIEIESRLVDEAIVLAERHGVAPTFGVGSFIPDEFRTSPRRGNVFVQTQEDGRSAYDQLDMELRDFDVVYAYPWPGEYQVFREIIRRYASPHTYFLCYDAREGITLSRPAKHRRPRRYR